MNKDLMLDKIAQKGYDVFYAANLNFATYDIVRRVPSMVSFLSIAIGVLGLVFESFRVVGVSVSILLLGIASLYVEKFTSNVEEYCKRGSLNTDMFNKLKNLYYRVKETPASKSDFNDIETQYEAIEQEFQLSSSAKQIFFANWYAHYKMFVVKDYKWMDDRLHFKWWKDKVPGSAKVVLFLILAIIILILVLNWNNGLV